MKWVLLVIAVTLKESNTLIGMAGIGNNPSLDEEIGMDYFISQQYSNQGYMTEALKSLSTWAFNTLKLDRLMVIIEPENLPSQRVIEKCGFTKYETKMVHNAGREKEIPYYYYRLNSSMS